MSGQDSDFESDDAESIHSEGSADTDSVISIEHHLPLVLWQTPNNLFPTLSLPPVSFNISHLLPPVVTALNLTASGAASLLQFPISPIVSQMMRDSMPPMSDLFFKTVLLNPFARPNVRQERCDDPRNYIRGNEIIPYNP